MKKHLVESSRIVWANGHFILILLVLGLLPQKTIVAPLLLVVVVPVIYGRLAEIAMVTEHTSYTGIFRKHWLNCFVVSIVCGVPVLILRLVIEKLGGAEARMISAVGLPAVVAVLTLYVFPLVFIERRSVAVIPWGVRYLLANFRYSLPLILLILLRHSLWVVLLPVAHSDKVAMLAVRAALEWWITLAVFTTATIILTRESSLTEPVRQ